METTIRLRVVNIQELVTNNKYFRSLPADDGDHLSLPSTTLFVINIRLTHPYDHVQKVNAGNMNMLWNWILTGVKVPCLALHSILNNIHIECCHWSSEPPVGICKVLSHTDSDPHCDCDSGVVKSYFGDWKCGGQNKYDRYVQEAKRREDSTH